MKINNIFLKISCIITALIICYNTLIGCFKLFNNGNFLYNLIAIILLIIVSAIMYYTNFLTQIKFKQNKKQ